MTCNVSDNGFRKWGFDRRQRRSFTDVLDQIKQNSNGRFHYFLPCLPDEAYLDQNFNPVARYQVRGPGSRHRARTANTSAVTNTKSRWPVEGLFGKEQNLQIMAVRYEFPQQYFSPCNIPGFENQPMIFIWLSVCDIIIRNYTAPFTQSYPTVDTYFQHWLDLRARITMENPLSDFSGILWSRNIFQRPTVQEVRNGTIQTVNLMDPNATGLVAVTRAELSSMTLGSFQPKMAVSYVTKLRKKEVDQLPFVNIQTTDNLLTQLPNVEAYIWDEVYSPIGPPGWDQNMYWPWEDVRLLLTFIPARMKSDQWRSVVLMYKPNTMPGPSVNNMGFRTQDMARMKGWICGPTGRNSCPLGERLAGCCSHCATAMYIGAVIPANQQLYQSKSRGCHLLDRANPQAMDEEVIAQITS